MGHDDSDRCVVEVVDVPGNKLMKAVYASTYGPIAEISLEWGLWQFHWLPFAAALRTNHSKHVTDAVGPIIERLNLLHKVTQRLTR